MLLQIVYTATCHWKAQNVVLFSSKASLSTVKFIWHTELYTSTRKQKTILQSQAWLLEFSIYSLKLSNSASRSLVNGPWKRKQKKSELCVSSVDWSLENKRNQSELCADTVNSWENVLMVMYASDIPSLGRDVLVEIFCTGTPSTDGTFIFSCSC